MSNVSNPTKPNQGNTGGASTMEKTKEAAAGLGEKVQDAASFIGEKAKAVFRLYRDVEARQE